MSGTAAETRFARAPTIAFVDMEDGGVVYRHADTKYYGLNETGSFILNFLSAPRTKNEIRDAVCEEFEVNPEQAARDVDGFIGKMLADSLIMEAPTTDERPG